MIEENLAICIRCGFQWNVSKSRLAQGQRFFCKSCRSAKRFTVENGAFICVPHQGQFGEDLVTPYKDGEPYLPGVRICGKQDRVEPLHCLG